jgi:hypothetical protein
VPKATAAATAAAIPRQRVNIHERPAGFSKKASREIARLVESISGRRQTEWIGATHIQMTGYIRYRAETLIKV